MKKPIEQRSHDDLRPEYDFASMKGGVRGKHYEQYCKGTNIVRVDPESRSFDSAPARPSAGADGRKNTRALRSG